MTERSIVHAWKACVPQGTGGSNPPPSAIFEMNNLFPFVLSAMLCLAGCTLPSVDGWDRSIVPGERVGAITADTSRADLITLYGTGNLSDTDYPIGEGETVPGTIVFPGSSREATVIWAPQFKDEKVDRVVITGQEWLLPEGIRRGDNLAAVEKINGAPFMIYGFGWDYGGVGYFKGGRLDRKVQVWFRPFLEEGPAYEAVLGDSLFHSGNAAMRAVDPRIEKVAVVLGTRHD